MMEVILFSFMVVAPISIHVGLTAEHLKAFIPTFLSQLQITALAFGNVSSTVGTKDVLALVCTHIIFSCVLSIIYSESLVLFGFMGDLHIVNRPLIFSHFDFPKLSLCLLYLHTMACCNVFVFQAVGSVHPKLYTPCRMP